jgi:hypothetical protein
VYTWVLKLFVPVTPVKEISGTACKRKLENIQPTFVSLTEKEVHNTTALY